MKLNDIRDNEGARHRKMRVGRGIGSGKGKTAGRGQKGQKSRSGVAIKGFEGGQMRLHMRIPKRGFNNRWASTIFAVNVGQINDAFDDGAEVTLEALSAKDLAKGTFDEVKILGDGDVTKKLTISAHRFSKSAEEKITAAGGKVNKLPAKRTPEERVEALQADKAKA